MNIALFFDDPAHPDTNVGALLELLDSADQLTWRSGARGVDGVALGYRYLIEHWRPGDAIFLFGSGEGAYRAGALTRMLGTIGVVQQDGGLFGGWFADGLLDYILANWASPRTRRTHEDWHRLDVLAAELRGGRPAVPVRYLGLWDTTKPAGLQPLSTLTNVIDGRHAVSIDERRAPELVHSRTIDEVWFRGTHADVAGATDAAAGLARITLEWVHDGARRAGLRTRVDAEFPALPSPTVLDALASGPRNPAMSLLTGVRFPNRLRALPEGARVHASVDVYLGHRPHYWSRLPHCLTWADIEWPERGERLLRIPRADRALQQALQQAS